MSNGPYFGIIQRFLASVTPWFISQQNIGTLIEAAGATQDAALGSLLLGCQQTRPSDCDVTTLPVLSRDRSLALYPTEPVASQRLRLQNWEALNRQRGTHQGELRHMQPYFLPSQPVMRVVHQSGDGLTATWHTLDGSGNFSIHQQQPSNWNFDGVTWKTIANVTNTSGNAVSPIAITTDASLSLVLNQWVKISGVTGNTAANQTARVVGISGPTGFTIAGTGNGAYAGGGTVAQNMWARFWVIVYPPLAIEALTTWDDGHVWDDVNRYWDGVAGAVIADVIQMVKDWKAAHSILWGIIFCTDSTKLTPTGTASTLADGSTTYPTGNWGQYINAGTGAPTRPPFAHFVYDLRQA